MNKNLKLNIGITLWTLTSKEIRRFMRIWVQTLVPPAVTMTLYFVIFGSLIGPRIGEMDGFDYVQFMIPGLIMMSVITGSYTNVVSSFYSVKFQKSIEELLISPMPNWVILLGFILGGVTRGILVGITDISSKLSAKTAFIKPINANKTDVKKSTVIVNPILAI